MAPRPRPALVPSFDPDPRTSADLAGREVGPYRIEGRVGGGGMGVVYRATDTRLGRPVALKFLAPRLHADPTARARLLQEARAAAALDHPHVAGVYDVGETPEGRLYLAMAYYEGDTLAERLSGGPLGAAEAVALAVQIARGLGAAHRAGIVHRDVKPANVMVLPEGGPDGGPCAKVLDFGIARLDGGDLTRTGESLGTARYMAPEQVRGGPVDARTDVWGLGAVLYEMLSGRPPFAGDYAAAVGYAVLHEAPPPLPGDLPAGLEAVVARCLAKDPAARFASMAALVEGLDGVRRGRPAPGLEAPDVGARPVEARPVEARPAPALRRWGAAALVAVVAAVAVAVSWTALRPGEAAAEPRRLAVLPFTDLGDDAGGLSVGLVETVTAKLAQLAPLRAHVRVVPASEVEPGLTPSEARERFGATLVVEGTVQAEAGRVRVTLSLVDVGGGAPSTLGSREVDDASGSAFALQDAAVLEVADLLRVEIEEATRQSLTAGGTADPEANALYLRGRGWLHDQQSVGDLDQARALFTEAIAEDSAFALAYAGLAEAEWETYRSTDDVAWARRAIANAERALGLDDRLAAVHAARGKIHRGLGDYELALEALDRALALDPEDPEAARQLALVYADMGRAREAEDAFRRAIALAPDSWRPLNSFGSFYLAQGRDADAARQYRRALAVAPDLLGLRYNLGVAAYRGGDPVEARQAFEGVLREDSLHAGATLGMLGVLFTLNDYPGAVRAGERAVDLLPDSYDARFGLAEARWWAGERARAGRDYEAALDLARESLRLGRTPDLLVAMAGAFAASGRRDSARAYLREIERALDPDRADVGDAYATGVAYEVVGDRDRALAWLGSALARGYGRVQAERSPWLADLRSTPAFQQLVD